MTLREVCRMARKMVLNQRKPDITIFVNWQTFERELLGPYQTCSAGIGRWVAINIDESLSDGEARLEANLT